MSETNPAWWHFCRALAESSARRETRRAYGVGESEPVRFENRWEHVQQVVQTALWLAGVSGADAEIVEAAAWLHDIRKGERHHAQVAADEIPGLLAQTDFPPGKVEAVVEAVLRHEGLTRTPGAPPLRPLEAAVLWDADKLVKVGVRALAYTLSAHWFDGSTLAERRRSVDEFVRGPLADTVESFSTDAARELGSWRYAAMVAALDAWTEDEAL